MICILRNMPHIYGRIQRQFRFKVRPLILNQARPKAQVLFTELKPLSTRPSQSQKPKPKKGLKVSSDAPRDILPMPPLSSPGFCLIQAGASRLATARTPRQMSSSLPLPGGESNLPRDFRGSTRVPTAPRTQVGEASKGGRKECRKEADCRRSKLPFFQKYR